MIHYNTSASKIYKNIVLIFIYNYAYNKLFKQRKCKHIMGCY